MAECLQPGAVESRQWRPENWTREIVRRVICKARRQVYRIAQRGAVNAEEARGFGEAVMALCQSEAALESIECGAIAETCARAARRLRVIELPKPVSRTSAIESERRKELNERERSNRSKGKPRDQRRQTRGKVLSDSRRLA